MNQNLSSLNRHQLLLSVNQEMESVQEAVDHISYLRGSLEEKSQKLKLEIRSNFKSIFDQLHAREEQLLRQVDVLTNNQRTSLYTQIAKMYYIMGRLKSSMESLQNDEIDLDDFNLPINDMDSVRKVQLQTLPSYSLHWDTNKLENTIQDFGRLDVLSTLLSFSPPEGSRSLPSSVEDYQVENEDHHVMHKTLFDQHSVKIRPPFKISPDVKKDIDDFWLMQDLKIRLELDQDEKFIALNAPSSDNGSFSVISPSRSSSPYEVVNPTLFLHSQSSQNEWLNDTRKNKEEKCRWNREIEDSVTSCYPSSTSLLADNSIDKWLSKKCEIESTCVVPKVSDICMANEMCDSFRDCLCNQNCAVQWLHNNGIAKVRKSENLVETKRITSSVLEPMMKILYGKNEDYLKSGIKQEKSNFRNIQAVDDVKNWLLESKSLELDETKNVNEINKKVKEMFKPYFVDDLTQWLSNH